MADVDSNSPRENLTHGPAAGDPHPKASSAHSARQVAEQAKQDARDTVDHARARMASMFGDQKQVAADQVEGLARALRKTVEQLDAQDQGAAARYVERAADGLEALGGALRDRDIDSLTTQVQDFARKQPGVFLGGAVAAGFLVARFLKSSSPSSSLNESYAGRSRYPQPGSTSESISTPT
jgi:hypothetical protein